MNKMAKIQASKERCARLDYAVMQAVRGAREIPTLVYCVSGPYKTFALMMAPPAVSKGLWCLSAGWVMP